MNTQDDKIGRLTQLLDHFLGTPCEQIRHQQEIERLQRALGEKYREGYDNALAEQPFDRAAVIEECARVAQEWWKDQRQPVGYSVAGFSIAAAIRALKDKP